PVAIPSSLIARGPGHARLDLRISSRTGEPAERSVVEQNLLRPPAWEHDDSLPDWNPIPPESLWKSHMEILRENEIADKRSNPLGTQLALALAVAMVFQVSA